jgi:carbon starvation protein
MGLPLLAVGFMVLLFAGYRLYGRWVAAHFGLDDAHSTPAHQRADGIDFVATPPFYLFAQHFSAIAAAGPIVGPILACQTFGWLPCLLWIGFGVIFIGAVHDFSSLVASVRHGGGSVAEIARTHLGAPAGRALLAFIWIALVYVIVAFVDITAASFVAGTEELRGALGFDPGGAVAMASTLYLLIAVAMGLVQRFLAPPLWLLTLVFVPATFGVAWLGTQLSDVLQLGHGTWTLLILAYCAVASVVPVWSLLQPRGYLGGFVLYTAIALGVIGVLFGGYAIEQPAFKTWDAGGPTGSLFPFLFVTIACGACSGFHGLVCSGTTSKQIARESHTRFVGYGAMLAEGFVAFIALVTVMIVAPATLGASPPPGKIYGDGIGRFLTLLLGEQSLGFATTFGAMALSTFVFDTIDVSTRLGRYIVQELFGWRSRLGAVVGTIATVVVAAIFLRFGGEGSYRTFWTLFGASNQLLAALTLVAVAAWLRQDGRPAHFVAIPMAFVISITLWALTRLLLGNLEATQGVDIAFANAVAAAVLIALALFLLYRGWRGVRAAPEPLVRRAA